MDYKDLTALSIKIAATIILFWYVAAFPAALSGVFIMFKNQEMYEQANQIPAWQGALFRLVPPLTGMAVALFVFLFPRSVSNHLVAGTAQSTQPEVLLGLQIAALRVIGVFYIYRALVDLAFYVTKVYARDASQGLMFNRYLPVSWTPEELAGVVSSAAELLFAVGLVLGARGLVGIVERLRGRNEAVPE